MLQRVDEELISRKELEAALFAIADLRVDVRASRRYLLEEDDGEEAPEADT